MSRAVILPTPSDPVMINFWLKCYDKWSQAIDTLYIISNTPSTEAIEITKELALSRPNVKVFSQTQLMDHGNAIDYGLEQVVEDYVMLIEDDHYIWSKTFVDNVFKMLENDHCDLVGSKRNSCSDEIVNQAAKVWGLSYEGYGDQGCNFWPSLLFVKTETLKKTNRKFCATVWKRGEIIHELQDYKVRGEVCPSDTFVWASLQLRNLIPQSRIVYTQQNHGGLNDLSDYQNQRNLFDGSCEHIHVGSLSSGFHGVLRDSCNRPLASRKIIEKCEPVFIAGKPFPGSDVTEWERRVAWWWLMSQYVDFDHEIFGLYKQALEMLVDQFHLNMTRIVKSSKMYQTIIKI